MNTNVAIDYRNSVVIREMGIDALTKALGPIGMAHFMQQFDRGHGDYTEERKELLEDVTMDDLVVELKILRRN